ncbi:hypothetical protein Ahy_B03g062003 [Arachis hypogaea]|uniref:RNA-dependent RNA polymerase n=1 Tax=Arachis hypogaea TaxID=3818 RepID=A0A444ZSS0_ARAHY|nr:hypothetical protein Ahy_B03g062003 [Arachis hypogaea]
MRDYQCERECKIGFHVLPLLSITEFLFSNVDFVNDLVKWSPSLYTVGDGWMGFVYALEGIYNNRVALEKIRSLKHFDAGNTLFLMTGSHFSIIMPTVNPPQEIACSHQWIIKNFVEADGHNSVYIHPYLIKSSASSVSLYYASRSVDSASITQVFKADLTISSSTQQTQRGSHSHHHVIFSFSDLSVTLHTPSFDLTFFLVRGCPYATFSISHQTPLFSITTVHKFSFFTSNSSLTKYAFKLDNGQAWLLLEEGFHLCGRKYSFLAFSSNHLRDCSAWFFANASNETCDTIRNWMGKFKIYNIAKCAARMEAEQEIGLAEVSVAMAAESSRSCQSRSSAQKRELVCRHGERPVLRVSGTRNNPERRFWGCVYYEIQEECDFFRWADPEADSDDPHVARMKRKLAAMKAKVRDIE